MDSTDRTSALALTRSTPAVRDCADHPSSSSADADTSPAARRDTVRLRLLAAAAAGIVVGSLTSFGQTHLDGTLNPLVNSASAWLVVPFLVGASMRSPSSGALAGVLACAMQVIAYFATSELREFPASSYYVIFWMVCAVVGGPLFGAGGQLWRSGRERLAGPASTLLPAIFLAEGIWVYGIALGYVGSTILWSTIGTALALVITRPAKALRWLPIAVSIGVVGEALLTEILSQPL